MPTSAVQTHAGGYPTSSAAVKPRLSLIASMRAKLVRRWRVFWLWRGSYTFTGRMASRLAGIGIRPYQCRAVLVGLTKKGYISPRAEIFGLAPSIGRYVFIGDRAVIARWKGDGAVTLGNGVQINRDCTLEVLEGGAISIGDEVGIQNGCVLLSAVQPIIIKRRAEIACHCAFYSYNHGIEAGEEIYTQPLTAKGPIVVEEDAWLGVGVKVMSGVRIGRGAVVGAGSVVTRDIPDYAIAAGVPAHVIKFRSGPSHPPADLPAPPKEESVGA